MKNYSAKLNKYSLFLFVALLITAFLSAGTALAKYITEIEVGNFNLSITATEQAYAVYSESDNSLEFFYGRPPRVGVNSPTDKPVTKVYIGIENKNYYGDTRGWKSDASKIKTVRFIGGTEEDGTPRKIQPQTMSGWFNEFTYVTSFDFSGLDTSNVTSMYQTFRKCERLQSLDLRSLNTSNVTSMQGMFLSCKKLKTLDVSNLNTSKVTTMQHMFSVCYALETLDLSSFDTSKVINMSSMFSADPGKSVLKNINLTSFNTAAVSNMQNMFYHCEQLSSLDLRSFDTSLITDTQQMFLGCIELVTVYVGADWDISQVTKAKSKDMFRLCENIVGSNGTTYDLSYVDKTYAIIDGTDGNNGYLTGEIVQSDDSDKNYFAVYGQAFNKDKVSIGNALYFYDRDLPQEGETQITFEDGSYQEIEDIYDDLLGAPWSVNASNIQAVNIVDRIEPTSTAYWFSGFSACESFEGLEKLITTKATSMTYMFKDCTKLNNTDLSALVIDTAAAKSLNGMFYLCTNLTNSNGNTFNFTNSAVAADANAPVKLNDLRNLFRSCEKLQKIDLRNLLTAKDNVYFAYMFFGCKNMTTIDLSGREVLSFAPLSENSTKPQSGTAYMFANCHKLAGALDISFIKCKTPYALEMFSNCYEITAIIVDTAFGYDGATVSMFADCKKLVGGNGTSLVDIINSTYARIDGADGQPGYFTGIVQPKLDASLTGVVWSFDGVGNFNIGQDSTRWCYV